MPEIESVEISERQVGEEEVLSAHLSFKNPGEDFILGTAETAVDALNNRSGDNKLMLGIFGGFSTLAIFDGGFRFLKAATSGEALNAIFPFIEIMVGVGSTFATIGMFNEELGKISAVREKLTTVLRTGVSAGLRIS